MWDPNAIFYFCIIILYGNLLWDISAYNTATALLADICTELLHKAILLVHEQHNTTETYKLYPTVTYFLTKQDIQAVQT